MLTLGRRLGLATLSEVKEQFAQALSHLVSPMEISLAFAGGGCKAFYGLGVGFKLREWGVKIKEISGVSAGAAMALCVLSESEEESVQYFEAITARNPANFSLANLWKGDRAFPHEQMYRRGVRFGMRLEKIRASGSKIFIHTVKAHPKDKSLKNRFRIARLISETARSFVLDDRDRSEGKPGLRTAEIVKKWNMQDVDFTEKDFANETLVEQFVMNSSCIPPIMDLQSVGNEYYFDGGLTNNLVLEKFESNAKIIGVYYEPSTIFGKSESLLSKTFLLKPSQKLPITSFDYTNPEGIRKCYELGKSDADSRKEEILTYIRGKTQVWPVPPYLLGRM